MAVLEFRTIESKILYLGTPVTLISSLNEDRTTNLAPMSSFWVLGWTHPECVVNIPSPELWKNIDPAKWSPLIYNFRHYFRLAERELGKTFRAERSEFDFEAFPK